MSTGLAKADLHTEKNDKSGTELQRQPYIINI